MTSFVVFVVCSIRSSTANCSRWTQNLIRKHQGNITQDRDSSLFTQEYAKELFEAQGNIIYKDISRKPKAPQDLICMASVLGKLKTILCYLPGRYQSMKPMIGKSIDQSMTIDALLVNWHRLASANRWPIDNHTKVVATHRLSSIGVEKISVSHTFQPVRIRTRSTHKCLTFEFVHRIVCMLLRSFCGDQYLIDTFCAACR